MITTYKVLCSLILLATASANASAVNATQTPSSTNVTILTNVTNATSILLANDTTPLALSNLSITDLAPMIPVNSSSEITNSTPTVERDISRNWIGIVSPVSLVTVIEVDHNRAVSSSEVDPFRFTSVPSSAPSLLPSAEPSLWPTSSPTPRPTIWKETTEPRNADRSYFDYNPKRNSRYGPGQKETYEVKKDGSMKIVYENNNWENVKDSPEELYWRPLQKDIKYDLSKNSCASKGSRFQSPIDIWPSDDALCEEHHQIRHRPGDFRIDGAMIEKQILSSKLRIVFPRRVGEEPDPPFADFPNGWGASVDALHADIQDSL